MSDTLKTAVSYINRWNRWDDGEQPTAEKFKYFFAAYSASLNTIANLLGPSFDSAAIATTKERVTSSRSYQSLMSAVEQEDFLTLANTQITNTFNLARVIGSHAVLNPQHLPGSVHYIQGQAGLGQALATGTKQQQLAFPPIEGYTWAIYPNPPSPSPYNWQRAGDENSIPASKEGIAAATAGRYFYIDESGTLYSNQSFLPNQYIKYDLKVPNTYSYVGAGYNCIPDLSILTIEDGDRLQDGEYGALRLSYDPTYISTSYSRWKVRLPKVTSLRDSIFKTNEKQVAADGYEPAGTYSVTVGKRARYYTLPTELYLTSAGESYKIEDNLICLYNESTKENFMLRWEIDPDSALVLEDANGNPIQNAFYCYGPKSLESIFYNDSGSTLLSSNSSLYNSKDFFMFVVGSTITEQLAQTSLNFSRHRHDGSDSYRIHHNDLLGAQAEIQGLGGGSDSNGGLSFTTYNRQLAYSEAKDNVHPQYLHRLGYKYGGTGGRYERDISFNKILDLNMFHGDLVLGPIEYAADNESGVYSYKYSSALEATSADFEAINWTLSSESEYIWAEISSYAEKRSHSIMFGHPSTGNTEFNMPWSSGLTRLYFEPHAFETDTKYDKKGQLHTLSRHGFVPGEATNRKIASADPETGLFSYSNHIRGLNLTYGNLFFGYREDLFGGLLTIDGVEETESSAYFRASEFNIVTTANGKSGQNESSKIKTDFSYRDGFVARSLKGSSVWLSTGADTSSQDMAVQLADIVTGQNEDLVPGTIALEASYFPVYNELSGGANSLLTREELNTQATSGAGIFTSPGAYVNTPVGTDRQFYVPWAHNLKLGYNFANLWNNEPFLELPAHTGNFWMPKAGYGSLLDIFSLAPDVNKSDGSWDDGAVHNYSAIPRIADAELGTWIFGRPLIRGTYGIDFCLDGQTDNLPYASFRTGFALKNLAPGDRVWGPNKAYLSASSSNSYIHREFRFWGKNKKVTPNASYSATDSVVNTQGGNVNLLYNYGRGYKRFGLQLDWSIANNSLNGGTSGSPWSNARRISLGSSKPENYGSAIRQASYVEAFQGLRNDPTQPFVAEYVYPFRALIDTGLSYDEYIAEMDGDGNITYASNSFDITKSICEKNIMIVSNEPTGYVGNFYKTSYYDSDNTVLAYIRNSTFASTTVPTIDSIIRGSEEIYLENASDVGTSSYPRSLVDFKINLDYFIGKKVIKIEGGVVSEMDEEQDPLQHNPHNALDAGKSYGQVIAGLNVMVPASGFGILGPSSAPNAGTELQNRFRFPVVMSNRQPQTYMINEGSSQNNTSVYHKNNPNAIIGYQDFLGTIPCNNTYMNTYNSRFPLYKNLYYNKYFTNNVGRDFHKWDIEAPATPNSGPHTSYNNAFIPIVNIPDFYLSRATTTDRYVYNFAVPYRVYIGDTLGNPIFLVSAGTWKYGNNDSYAFTSEANVKIWVELRGKMIVKAITNPVNNSSID
jgi:hypothetical protein